MSENVNNANTINMSLAEYKNMMEEVSNAKKQVSDKEEIISSLKGQLTLAEHEVKVQKDKVVENTNCIYVLKMPVGYIRDGAVKLDKADPIVYKMIDESFEKYAKTLQVDLDTAKDQMAQMSRDAEKSYKELKENKNEQINNLNKKIEDITKDYEDLKLDKAAAIVESERLAEINDLKNTIELKDCINSMEDNLIKELPLLLRPFKSTIFNIIRRYNDKLLKIKDSKDRYINTTTAYGKAKDYLKTLQSQNQQNIGRPSVTWSF